MRASSTAALVACAALSVSVWTIATAQARAATASAGVFTATPARTGALDGLNTLLLRPDARPGAIREIATHRAARGKRPKKVDVAGWVIDGFGYLWGIDTSGKVLTYHDDCIEPGLGRVDHAGNLIVACMGGGETNGIPGNVNVYAAGNTSSPADIVLTDTSGYLPFDVFEDGAGNIYAVNAIQYVCGPLGCNVDSGNIVRWSIGNQKSGALPDATYADANLFQYESADVDAAGTIFVDGFSAAGSPELDSLNGAVATNLDVSLVYPGGVYVVSPNGPAPVLSVLDQVGHKGPTLYQFGIHAASAVPTVTAVTPQNFEHRCDPVAAGYGPAGARASLGLQGCKANAQGAPATGRWTVRQNLDYVEPYQGLFVPSDK